MGNNTFHSKDLEQALLWCIEAGWEWKLPKADIDIDCDRRLPSPPHLKGIIGLE